MKKRSRVLIWFLAAVIIIVIAVALATARILRRRPTLPEVEPIVLETSNPVEGIAEPGDRVTLRFTLSKHTDSPIEVIIGGRAAERIELVGERTYEAARTVDASDLAGPLEFVISVGGTQFTRASDDSTLTIVAAEAEPTVEAAPAPIETDSDIASLTIVRDATVSAESRPDSLVIRSLDIRSTNPNREWLARPGDEVVIRFRVSKPLSEPPVVSIGGAAADHVVSRGEEVFEATRVVGPGVPEGRIAFTVAIVDTDGNRASLANTSSDGSFVKYDSLPALVTDIEITVDGRPPERLKPGDTVQVEFVVDEPLSDEPTVTIAGATADAVLDLGGRRYRAIRTVADGDRLDSAVFAIGQRDLAGNEAPEFSAPIGESRFEVHAAVVEPSQVVPADAESEPEPEIRPAASPVAGVRVFLSVEIRRSETPQAVLAEPAPEPKPDSVPIAEHEQIAATTVKPEPQSEPQPTPEPKPGPSPTIAPQPEPAPVALTEPVRPPEVDVEPEPAPADEAAPATTDTAVPAEPAEAKPVAFDSPLDGSYFGPRVVAAGSVARRDEIRSITWIVSPERFVGQQSQIITGEVDVDATGRFAIEFDTDRLEGNQQLRIEVSYSDGSSTVGTVTLLDGGDTIPGFSVASADRSIEARWEPLSYVSSYRLVAERLTGERESRVAEGVTSPPARMTGLRNGERYEILLEGYDENGESIVASDRITVIPLAPGTLEPSIDSRYGSMLIHWNEIAATDRFELYRATGNDEFTLLTIVEAASEYRDGSIDPGRAYRYAVKPAGLDVALSAAAEATALTEPTDRAAVLADIAAKTIYRFAPYGSYLLAAGGSGGVSLYDVSDPTRPALVTTVESTDARGIATYGELAYIAEGADGLRVLDLDSPTQPEVIGSRKTSDAGAVAIWSPDGASVFAFVADGEYGLKMVDATRPTAPERVDAVPTVDARDVAVSATMAIATVYVADGPGD